LILVLKPAPDRRGSFGYNANLGTYLEVISSVVLGKALAALAEEGLDAKALANERHLPVHEVRADVRHDIS
jgi:hypothetical protein